MLALSYIALEVIKLTKSASDPTEEEDQDLSMNLQYIFSLWIRPS